MITREHGTQVEAGDESLVLRCATSDEREAWVGAIQTDPNSSTLSLTTNPNRTTHPRSEPKPGPGPEPGPGPVPSRTLQKKGIRETCQLAVPYNPLNL